MAKELRAQSGWLIDQTARRPSEEKPVVNREGENNNSGTGRGGQTDRTKQSIIHLADLQPVNQSNWSNTTSFEKNFTTREKSICASQRFLLM